MRPSSPSMARTSSMSESAGGRISPDDCRLSGGSDLPTCLTLSSRGCSAVRNLSSSPDSIAASSWLSSALRAARSSSPTSSCPSPMILTITGSPRLLRVLGLRVLGLLRLGLLLGLRLARIQLLGRLALSDFGLQPLQFEVDAAAGCAYPVQLGLQIVAGA